MTDNIFEKASKQKLRFDSQSGKRNVEDLWDIPLMSRGVSLETIAKAVNRQIKESEEESFVQVASTKSTKLNLQMDILKHIIAVRLAQQEAAQNAKERAGKKAKILEALAQKEDESLSSKTPEELKAMLEGL